MSTVLIGYDGSEGGDRAVRAARAVLSADRVIVATVWEPSLPVLAEPSLGALSLPGVMLDPRTEQVLDDAVERNAHRAAARGGAAARAAGFTDVVEVVEVDVSDVAGALIRIAEEHGADAIAVGSHGHSGIVARVMGTTGTSLVRHAPCPVLVVPPGAAAD